ncbi:hypothetical protein RhiirA5_367353 [Rhizophagus irregularis]|uniref:Uncharacterized protein n=1 Tax=Rhizophagus irregularis TaxID=588596 RepID=A0A2N0NST3_9GLOM|nr:hypothetical protein RhiirA5_367353 [Rhizophagus irregularis]
MTGCVKITIDCNKFFFFVVFRKITITLKLLLFLLFLLAFLADHVLDTFS